MATSSTAEPKNAENSDAQVPEWVLARKGLDLVINNDPKGAQEIFSKYPDSLTMYAGYSFATFMDALMTFEEEKLTLATATLKDVERRCVADHGWLKTMKKAFTSNDTIPLSIHLETQIILADSQVCLAILTFLQHDISGYFKGGWILRKAWKAYQNAYHEILQLYKEIIGETYNEALTEVMFESNSTSTMSTPESETVPDDSAPSNGYKKIPYSHSTILSQRPHSNSFNTFLKKSFSVNSALSKYTNKAEWAFTSSLSFTYLSSTLHLFSSTEKLKQSQIDKATIERLMSAVSFGYGLFQLGISLLPPSLLKLTNFLGFGGNRQNGIGCLMYAREGVDMRAPLATLSLLWYHTIVRPFYAIDGSNVQAGVEAARKLLEESDKEYGNSALFLFFKGRVNRLNSNIPKALESFQASVENAAQREIKILSMHEVGWCHLIQLDYCNAESTFNYLKSWSRWSRFFYTYLAGICCGSCGGSAIGTIKEISTVSTGTNKGNQLEEFLTRRAKYCPSDDELLSKIPPIYWKLLMYEMLYLWNALPSCSTEKIALIRLDCESLSEEEYSEPMRGLSKLILGCCYCIEKEYHKGMENFRLCLELRKDIPHNASDAHVSAFSLYELGALLIKSDETKSEGKMHLQSIASYKDYDFEQRLNVKVHSMLKHL